MATAVYDTIAVAIIIFSSPQSELFVFKKTLSSLYWPLKCHFICQDVIYGTIENQQLVDTKYLYVFIPLSD